MSEEWNTIPSYPDYEASSEGQIRRCGKLKPQKPHLIEGKYLRVHLYGRARARVNRLVCEAFHGKPPSGEHEAAHNDGDHGNNRAANLRWATHQENEDDKLLHGTLRRGERQGRAKLTEQKVREIRALVGTPQRILAAKFGVCQRTICVILTRRGWTHV